MIINTILKHNYEKKKQTEKEMKELIEKYLKRTE